MVVQQLFTTKSIVKNQLLEVDIYNTDRRARMCPPVFVYANSYIRSSLRAVYNFLKSVTNTSTFHYVMRIEYPFIFILFI